MEENITIIWKFTNQLTETDIRNFLDVYTDVYGESIGVEAKFKKKYLENIYGNSLILFGFINDKCVAIQSFLRNDLNGKLAYQSGDSATKRAGRGKGLFSTLVKKGIEVLPSDAIVYGYPNENSLPIFKKMGWTIGKRKKTGLFFGKRDLIGTEIIDIEYTKWLIQDSTNYFYSLIGEKVVLLRKKRWNVYQVLGQMQGTKSSAKKIGLKKAWFPILFSHKDNGTLGKGLVPISFRKSDLELVPLYKLDVFIVG